MTNAFYALPWRSEALPRICDAPRCLNDPEPGRRYCRACDKTLPARDKEVEPTVRRLQKGRAFIYAVGGDEGPIKIGQTRNIAARLRAMAGGSPIKLRVLGKVISTPALELALHRHLAAFRSHGEWFDRTGEVERIVHMLSAGQVETLETLYLDKEFQSK